MKFEKSISTGEIGGKSKIEKEKDEVTNPDFFRLRMKEDVIKNTDKVQETMEIAESFGLSAESLEIERKKVTYLTEVLHKAMEQLLKRTELRIREADNGKTIEEKIGDILVFDKAA